MAFNGDNNAPRVTWFRAPLACGTVRHRLYVEGKETEYFVDDAKAAGIGHHAQGCAVQLWASGCGPEIRCRNGTSYRIAAMVPGFKNVTLAKMAAERMATL